MNQTSHDHHFVPQLYLKQWSDDGTHIWAYRILVSSNSVPDWSRRSISRAAYMRDLYTIHDDGEDFDDFEKWLNDEFENPVTKSIKKVLKDNPLTTNDWERLAMFLGAQDVRTPLNYLESTERWEKTFPEMLKSSVDKSLQKNEKGKNQEDTNKPLKADDISLEKILKLKPVQSTEMDSEQGYIHAELIAGRRLWLQSQKLLLKKTANVLKTHKWSIVRPAKGHQWFTSDHPVVKLNYYGKEGHDLKGGWGNIGANIFMPLSPRHLLFTEIGKDIPDKMTFKPDLTKDIQMYLAERALRWIFADKKLKFINSIRPRRIDADLFQLEAEQWKNWHKNQIEAETAKG